MANEREYQGVQIGGRVPQRILGNRDLSAFQNYVQTRNQMWDEAIKQKSAIDVALGQIKLNSAEDKWKYDYGKKIQQRIDAAAQFGDYSRALDTAVLEAGKAVSSPEITGRIRANENYEKAKQEVTARNDINSITKERWLDQNKYHYEDTYDDDGNIVGGTDWQSSWNPVRRVQIEKLITLAGQLASPTRRSTSSQTSNSMSDEQGIGGKTEQGGSDGLHSVKLFTASSSDSSISRETLTKEKLDEVYNELFKLDPDNMNSLIQDYDDVKWKISKLKTKLNESTNEEEKTNIQNEIDGYSADIYDKDGNPLPVKDYMLSKVGLITKNMAYDNLSTSSKSSNNTGKGLRYTTKAQYANGGGSETNNEFEPLPTVGGTYQSSPSSGGYGYGKYQFGLNVNETTDNLSKAGMFK